MGASTAVRPLLRAQFVNSLGDGTYYVISTLYFTMIIGLSPASVGAGLSVAWGVGFLLSSPIGALADRIGLRRSAILLSVTTAISLALLTTVETWVGFTVVAVVYAVAQSGLGAVRQALLVVLVNDRSRVAVRGRLQAVLNGGLGLGAAAGAGVLAIGSDTAFVVALWADAAAFALASVLLWYLPEHRSERRHHREPATRKMLSDRRFLLATGLNAILYLYMPLLSVLLPVWIAAHTAAPHWFVGVLFALNTGGVVLLQSRVAKQVTGLASAARALTLGAVLLAAACLVLAASTAPSSTNLTLWVLLVGGVLLVLGEVHVAAGSWEVGFSLADPSHPGRWQGMYASGIPIARAIGPALLLAAVLAWPIPGWVGLAVLFLAAGTGLALVATTSHRAKEVAR